MVLASALQGEGLEAFWATVQHFQSVQGTNGQLALRRREQAVTWMWERINAGLQQAFREHPNVAQQLANSSKAVAEGSLVASIAAQQLLDLFSAPGGRAAT